MLNSMDSLTDIAIGNSDPDILSNTADERRPCTLGECQEIVTVLVVGNDGPVLYDRFVKEPTTPVDIYENPIPSTSTDEQYLMPMPPRQIHGVVRTVLIIGNENHALVDRFVGGVYSSRPIFGPQFQAAFGGRRLSGEAQIAALLNTNYERLPWYLKATRRFLRVIGTIIEKIYDVVYLVNTPLYLQRR